MSLIFLLILPSTAASIFSISPYSCFDSNTRCSNSCAFLRYVKSRSDKQLLYGMKYNDTSSCRPEELNNGLPVVPCGLIAWSLFNDSYSFFRGTDELSVNRKNIAWKSDREHKFGKDVFPFNFQNGSLIGGGRLDPHVPVSSMSVIVITESPF